MFKNRQRFIPAIVLKQCAEIYFPLLRSSINHIVCEIRRRTFLLWVYYHIYQRSLRNYVNTENTDQDSFTFGGLCFMNSKEKEILEANIDSKLSFNNHIQFVEKSVEKLIRKSLLSPEQMNTMTGIKQGRVKSCRLQVFLKKGVLKNFEIFTGKQNNFLKNISDGCFCHV